jgi:hypothetical protein
VSLIRRSLVKATAYNLKEYLDSKYCIEADISDLCEIINLDIGFVVDALEEQSEYYDQIYRSEVTDDCNKI